MPKTLSFFCVAEEKRRFLCLVRNRYTIFEKMGKFFAGITAQSLVYNFCCIELEG